MNNPQSVEIALGGRKLVLETGRVAGQASGAILARYGDTMVLATVMLGKERPELGYFPLTVDYIEKLYAGGRIKGSRWVKREGRPTDDAILKGRLIDRSIRPLFPKDFFREVQVTVTTLSVDNESDADILGIVAVSAALTISEIPWNGPVAAIRVGLTEDTQSFITNPVNGESEKSPLDLVVSATKDAILMVEAGAMQIDEERMLTALKYGFDQAQTVITAIGELQKKTGKEKITYETKKISEEFKHKIYELAEEKIKVLMEKSAQKKAGENDFDELKTEVYTAIKSGEDDTEKSMIFELVDKVAKEITRKQVLTEGRRMDGRKPEEIRPISTEVGVLPRTHGSAIFQRGETQALSIATLGIPSLEQWLEFPEGEERRRYIHHYNMPPFSTGECKRIGTPSRREVGHGALAERALLPVIPDKDSFPYAIRVVSEIMSSNGSTSMASVCGSTLSLMDAGVPIKEPVAGIAMGLITGGENGKYAILSDIVGFEDFFGDMDFKVAGTKKGITALQLDTKISGISLEIFAKAFEQAKVGRYFIMEKMLTVLPGPRPQLSVYAPRVLIIKIDPEKIGEIIGPGGKMIRSIMAQTETELDVDDDGSVTISGANDENIAKAKKLIEGLTKDLVVGDIYENAEVKRLMPFGAFVEVLPGKEGLVHVSQMGTGYVTDPSEIVKVGQKVKVRVSEIDFMGRTNLSMLFGEAASRPVVRQPMRRPPMGRTGFGGPRRAY